MTNDELFNALINLEAMVHTQQQVIEKVIAETGVKISEEEFTKFSRIAKDKVSATYPTKKINW